MGEEGYGDDDVLVVVNPRKGRQLLRCLEKDYAVVCREIEVPGVRRNQCQTPNF